MEFLHSCKGGGGSTPGCLALKGLLSQIENPPIWIIGFLVQRVASIFSIKSPPPLPQLARGGGGIGTTVSGGGGAKK